MLEAANSGERIAFPFDDNEVVVNSGAVTDFWISRWPHEWNERVLVEMFQVEPCIKGDSGIWQARQSIDISPAELKPKMLETLARGAQYMLKDQRVGFRV
ncbi:hypothetical protein OG21DRAFT_1516306 [Imleria badia]|nr:hypothetical protein OG21DRAFT_1516306 [Imleria badia]